MGGGIQLESIIPHLCGRVPVVPVTLYRADDIFPAFRFLSQMVNVDFFCFPKRGIVWATKFVV